jgi:hypothetical protein
MHRTAGTGVFCSSWCYRFLNFTHVAARAMGLLLLSFCILSPSFSLAIFRSFSHPRWRNPLLFYTARPVFVSFYLPVLLSPSRTLFLLLSLYGLLYALSNVPFVHARLFARANFESDSLRALRRKKRRKGSDESGQTAREQNDGREKNETMKGLKLIQLNDEERRRAGTRLIYFRSHPFALPPSSHHSNPVFTCGNIAFHCFSGVVSRGGKIEKNTS